MLTQQLSTPRPGTCGYTPWGQAGDCIAGWQGTWSLRRLGVANLSGCAEHCRARCARCRYVSFSVIDDDCSWFRICPQRLIPGSSHVSLAVNPDVRHGQLRIAWLGPPPDRCGETEENYLRTYCQQWHSLRDAAHVESVPLKDPPLRLDRSFRRSADVLLVPPSCCMTPTALARCAATLDSLPGDPPVVVMLNK
eukprot:995305-Prymnesium_polylepis.1